MGRAVVIGAGAIGVASAYFLQRSGWSVTVVDKGDIGRGCSYGNACLIVPSHSDPLPGPGVFAQALRWTLKPDSPFYVRLRFDRELLRWSFLFRRHCNRDAAARGYRALLGLSRQSLELYEELTRTKEADFFFERRGLLEVFLSNEGVEHGPRALESLAAEGFSARLLDRAEAQELEPALSDAVRGALYVEGEAHGFSYGYVRALANTCEKRGAVFVTGRGLARLLVEKNEARGVAIEAPYEEIAADLVVLAAGSWSRELAQPIGIDIPLVPAKGYSATIDTFDGAPRIPLLIQERRVIVTPLAERLRFGGTLELAGFDSTIDAVRYRAVVRAARDVLRAEPPMANEEAWAGLRPMTPDGLPIIDRARNPDGLIVATGHAMLGFTQSPVTGKLVAEIANGESPSLPLEPFRLDRF